MILRNLRQVSTPQSHMHHRFLILTAVLLVAVLTIAPLSLRSAQEEKASGAFGAWEPASLVRRFPRTQSLSAPEPPKSVESLAEPILQADDDATNRKTDSDAQTDGSDTSIQSDVFPNPADHDSLSEPDLPGLIGIAHSNSPSLRKLEARIDQARGLQFQATRSPNPTIGYQGQEIGNDGAFGQHGVFWSQTWIRGGKLELAGEVANWEAQRRGWEFQVERYRIANLVRQRYYNLLAARRVKQIANMIVEIADRNQTAVQQLFAAGEIARNELLQAKIERQRSELSQENASTALTRAERLLAIAVAVPDMDCSVVQGNILADVPQLTVAEIRSWLDEESPELEVARAEIERARWKVERESATPIPDVNTQLGLMYDDSTNHAIANLQVSWQVPKNDRNSGNIQAAQADLRRARHAMTELLLHLSGRVETSFRQYELSQQKVRAYETRVVALAKENLQITRESYKVGEASYQTLLTAQRSYFDSALALVESRRLLWQSVARLQGLVIPE